MLTDFGCLPLERFKRATREKLRGVRCPEHHQPPRLHFQGVSLRDVSIAMSGCCPQLMDLANARIAAVGTTETAIRKPA